MKIGVSTYGANNTQAAQSYDPATKDLIAQKGNLYNTLLKCVNIYLLNKLATSWLYGIENLKKTTNSKSSIVLYARQ